MHLPPGLCPGPHWRNLKLSGEGKWRGKEEKGMGGERSCSSKHSFKIPPNPSLTKNCHHMLSSPSSSSCPLFNTWPVLDRSSRCDWNKTNAFCRHRTSDCNYSSVNGMTMHNELSHKFRTLRFFGSDSHFDHRKKSKIVATMARYPGWKLSKLLSRPGSATDPAGGAYSAPQIP